MNFAVFASGRGSNLGAIISAAQKNEISAHLTLVISDKPDALALKIAQSADIAADSFDRQRFDDRQSFEQAILIKLQEAHIDFIVLAGFMRILSPQFVQAYPNKILNIHPSLLPAFKGAHAVKDAFAARVKETGVTVHFVDEHIDHGPIILQESVEIHPNDTLAKLEEKIHTVEHKLYPKAIDLFARGKLKIQGDRVVIE